MLLFCTIEPQKLLEHWATRMESGTLTMKLAEAVYPQFQWNPHYSCDLGQNTDDQQCGISLQIWSENRVSSISDFGAGSCWRGQLKVKQPRFLNWPQCITRFLLHFLMDSYIVSSIGSELMLHEQNRCYSGKIRVRVSASLDYHRWGRFAKARLGSIQNSITVSIWTDFVNSWWSR